MFNPPPVTSAVILAYTGTSVAIVGYGPTYVGQKAMAKQMALTGGITKIEVYSNYFCHKWQTTAGRGVVETTHPKAQGL